MTSMITGVPRSFCVGETGNYIGFSSVARAPSPARRPKPAKTLCVPRSACPFSSALA